MYHTLPQAASKLRVSYNTLYNIVRSGFVPCIKIDHVRLLTDAHVEQAAIYIKTKKETK